MVQTIVVFTVIREFCGQRLATIIAIIIRTYLYTSTHLPDCVRLLRLCRGRGEGGGYSRIVTTATTSFYATTAAVPEGYAVRWHETRGLQRFVVKRFDILRLTVIIQAIRYAVITVIIQKYTHKHTVYWQKRIVHPPTDSWGFRAIFSHNRKWKCLWGPTA